MFTLRKIVICILIVTLALTASPVFADNRNQDPDFLNLIGANRITIDTSGQKSITVAVIDTGVDEDHPALEKWLSPGKNFLREDGRMTDDNGHGTNVAGVIAQIWQKIVGKQKGNPLKILPIKALDENGFGDEEVTAEAVMYAVRQKANIIVMSLGLYKDNRFLRNAISYAVSQNILVVAASGNESNEVMFPAAYPEVFAIGGIGSQKQIVRRSNYGNHLDMVAGWYVRSAQSGGGTNLNEGSSMAAPQVAAVAAILWRENYLLNAESIKSRLIESAEDIDNDGWDAYTGYGMLRADQALYYIYSNEKFEPNDTWKQANPIPLSKNISQKWETITDKDTFSLQIPEKGKLTVSIRTEMGQEWMFSTPKAVYGPFKSGKTQTIPVEFGEQKIAVWQPIKFSSDAFTKREYNYQLRTDFKLEPDKYEPNDLVAKATKLTAKKQTVNATIHRSTDQDWYDIDVKQSGYIQIELIPLTVRMDPIMSVLINKDYPWKLDQGGSGDTEETPEIWVTKGNVRLLIQDINRSALERGYQLKIRFRTSKGVKS